MAHPATDLHYPPSYSKTFTTWPRVVSGSPNVDAPAKIYHMPCQLIVNAAAADVLAYTDNAGANSITFAAAGCYVLRLAVNSIDVGTTCDSVTVCWQAPLTSL